MNSPTSTDGQAGGSPLSRRALLRAAGGGAGWLGLLGLLDSERALAREQDPLAPRAPHHDGPARSVIWLFNGGPSHVDTWDHKPELEKRDGMTLEGFDAATGFFEKEVGGLMRSPFEFARRGESGSWVSEIFPHTGAHVDRMAFLHGCHTETNNHSPALFQMNTGMSRMGFPCVGSWATYGLGSMNANLPAFVVMSDPKGRGLPKGYAQNWSSGFLPGVYQGTALAPHGAPIANLSRRADASDEQQRRQLDLLARLEAAQGPASSELGARIDSYELAYRMQMSAPEALDLDAEPAATRELYGLDDPACAHVARQCLMARRLVERGVRFVQIYSGGEANEKSWDGHLDIAGNHRGFASEVDRPFGALLTDLARTGLLDSTLVVCCGEFGRLPLKQTKAGSTQAGRDHNPNAFTTWMAGGGVRGGVHHGATDEIGLRAEDGKVSVNDLHATMLHLFGLDHERLTYRYNGRDFRLTDVAGRVVHEILA